MLVLSIRRGPASRKLIAASLQASYEIQDLTDDSGSNY